MNLGQTSNCGAAVVLPGYAILLDDNGVLVVPPDEIEAATSRTVAMQSLEKDELLPKIGFMIALGDLSGATAMVNDSLNQDSQTEP
jgi:regulator of RNase E activity RraA